MWSKIHHKNGNTMCSCEVGELRSQVVREACGQLSITLSCPNLYWRASKPHEGFGSIWWAQNPEQPNEFRRNSLRRVIMFQQRKGAFTEFAPHIGATLVWWFNPLLLWLAIILDIMVTGEMREFHKLNSIWDITQNSLAQQVRRFRKASVASRIRAQQWSYWSHSRCVWWLPTPKRPWFTERKVGSKFESHFANTFKIHYHTT